MISKPPFILIEQGKRLDGPLTGSTAFFVAYVDHTEALFIIADRDSYETAIRDAAHAADQWGVPVVDDVVESGCFDAAATISEILRMAGGER